MLDIQVCYLVGGVLTSIYVLTFSRDNSTKQEGSSTPIQKHLPCIFMQNGTAVITSVRRVPGLRHPRNTKEPEASKRPPIHSLIS